MAKYRVHLRRGSAVGFTSRGHELVLLNRADPSLPNSVIVVSGRQGAGKTFLLQKLALWTRYGGGHVTVMGRAGRSAHHRGRGRAGPLLRPR